MSAVEGGRRRGNMCLRVDKGMSLGGEWVLSLAGI